MTAVAFRNNQNTIFYLYVKIFVFKFIIRYKKVTCMIDLNTV